MFPPPLSLNFPRQKTTMVHFTQLKNKIKPKPATLLIKPIFKNSPSLIHYLLERSSYNAYVRQRQFKKGTPQEKITT
jgi:hypothetical protein